MENIKLVFTNIQHGFRRHYKMSNNEYILCDMINVLSTSAQSSVSGWCYMSKQNIALNMDLTKRAVLDMIEKMILNGFIEKHPETKNLRTTAKWQEVYIKDKAFMGEPQEMIVIVRRKEVGEETTPSVKKLHQVGEETTPIEQEIGEETTPNTNIVYNNTNTNNIIASDTPLFPLVNPKTKQASKGGAEAQNSKLVFSAFDQLLTKHEIEYTYPKSAALWRPIHSCCKQILNEVGAEGVEGFFAKVDLMYKNQIFPFKDKSNLVLTFIGSAKVIPMILNHQATTPQNQVFQQPHPNFPQRPLYINLFADRWAKVKWWRTSLAELENGQDKEFSFAEISKMLQYTEPLNILK